ncbi:MAG: VCBS repeat-containing protein [Planctomycetes bacterium]|nr:VCBS repeat-containing protein [Planctomycetota bacterium]
MAPLPLLGCLVAVTVAVCSTAQAAPSPTAEPGELTPQQIAARIDPDTDAATWRAEALAARAGDRLALWFDALVRERSIEPPLPAAVAALREWATPFAGDDARVKVKVLSAELDRDGALGGGFVTIARIEAFGGGAGPLAQEVGEWRVRWRVGDGDALELDAIERLGGELRRSPARWFEDSTSRLLPRPLREREDLRFGGEYWPEHLDHVGETTRMGHQGLAVGDVDGDGREDLYVAMPNGLPNLLLRRRPDGRFEDTAAAAGVAWLDDTKGVLLVDIDGDGDDDLLAAIGPFVLIATNADGRFTPSARLQAPTGGAFYHLAVADCDGDGDLDLYGCRYVEEAYAVSVPMPYHDANNGPSNVLFRNDGEAGFVDATAELGLDQNNTRFSTAAAWADYDGDGDQDLYVSNDFGRNNLYRNDGGRFVDVAATAGVEDQAAGMGVAWADCDGDGDLDLYVTNMFSSAGHRIAALERFQPGMPAAERRALQELAFGNSLFTNRGDGTFERVADPSVRMGRWGWGARFADLDDDGNEDIVAPNGFLTGAHSAADC